MVKCYGNVLPFLVCVICSAPVLGNAPDFLLQLEIEY